MANFLLLQRDVLPVSEKQDLLGSTGPQDAKHLHLGRALRTRRAWHCSITVMTLMRAMALKRASLATVPHQQAPVLESRCEWPAGHAAPAAAWAHGAGGTQAARETALWGPWRAEAVL